MNKREAKGGISINMETQDSTNRLTRNIQKRYNRIAPVYDLMDKITVPHRMREKAINLARGEVLEVGVGTGLNLPLYPRDCTLTGIDFSPKMLQKARARATKDNIQVKLLQMDIQQLDFPDHSFDTVIATCVFCSVPDPILGLKEVRRVCKKDGQVILLEHMRSDIPLLGLLMDILNPLFLYIIGNNINRMTVENVKKAGLNIVRVENLKADIYRLIVASP